MYSMSHKQEEFLHVQHGQHEEQITMVMDCYEMLHIPVFLPQKEISQIVLRTAAHL